MGYTRVGVLGAPVISTNGGTPPALSFGQTPKQNNLLVCWAAVGGSTTAPTTPAGWSAPGSAPAGTSCTVMAFTKIAVGGDAAPSFALIAGATQAFMLGEFSGNLTLGALDRTVNAVSTTSPNTAALNNANLAAGEIDLYCCSEWYSAAAVATNTVVSNNCPVVNDTNNNGASNQLHYNFGYGVTNKIAPLDSVTLTFTTTNIVGTAAHLISEKVVNNNIARPLMGVG